MFLHQLVWAIAFYSEEEAFLGTRRDYECRTIWDGDYIPGDGGRRGSRKCVIRMSTIPEYRTIYLLHVAMPHVSAFLDLVFRDYRCHLLYIWRLREVALYLDLAWFSALRRLRHGKAKFFGRCLNYWRSLILHLRKVLEETRIFNT